MGRLAVLTLAAVAALAAPTASAAAHPLEPNWRSSALVADGAASPHATAASGAPPMPARVDATAASGAPPKPALVGGPAPGAPGTLDRVAAPTARRAWTATVRRTVTATARPGGGRALQRLAPRAPWWGGANVLLVTERPRTVQNETYVRVLLKRMPAGSAGWIPARAVRLQPTARRVVVDLSQRTVALQRDGRTLMRSRVVVGAAATPTPLGLFAVDAAVAQQPGGVLGPRVLALAAYSRTLTEFRGGIPQTAIHAYEQLGDPLGVAASNGCVRVPQPVVARLIAGAPRGTPVLIRR